MHHEGHFTELLFSQSDLSVDFQEPRALTENNRLKNDKRIGAGAVIDIESLILIPDKHHIQDDQAFENALAKYNDIAIGSSKKKLSLFK